MQVTLTPTADPPRVRRPWSGFFRQPRRVHVEWYIVLVSDTTDFGNRLNRADLVVRIIVFEWSGKFPDRVCM